MLPGMPARVLVYCKKPIGKISAAQLEQELRNADLMTLAEVHDLPEGEEAAVEEMWRCFRLDLSAASAEIHWHKKQRPIQIGWGPPLAGEMEETLGELPTTEAAQRVRARLEQTTHVVSFEMGIDGSHHLAATISEVLAFFFAERSDGIVWFYFREFASPDDRGATLLHTE